MAGYRLEYDHDWDLETTASDGRKRRSFLPAPKKDPGISPTSPQSQGHTTFLPQPQQQHLQQFSSSHHQPKQEQQQQHHQYYYHQQHQQQHYQQSQAPHGHHQLQRAVLQRQQPPQEPTPPPLHQPSRTSRRDEGSGGKQPTLQSTHKRSPSGSPHPDFGQGIRVGARIKIGGVKPGIVRYVGTIHLAPGIFCGVELVDADGTHDGEVNGHRYFTCPPQHGIFAPKNKVCLDPAYPPLKRLSSDSDTCYSSTESLAERSNQALRQFAEGELEAVDCTKIRSPTSGKEAPRSSTVTKLTYSHTKKVDLNATYDLEDSKDSSQARDFDDLPHPDSVLNFKPQRSVLPRPKSSLPAPTSTGHSRLPTFSKSFVKPSETITCPQDQLPGQNRQHPEISASQTQSILFSEIETASYAGDNWSLGDARHQRSASSRSSEDSEEDGALKDRLSSGVKHQLRGDSRHYLNFTFDKESKDSLDPDESGSDSNSRDNTFIQNQTLDGTARPVFSDSYLVGDASSHSILASDILADNSLTSGTPLEELLHAKRSKRAERKRTSTPIESRSKQSQILGSRSYVLGQGQGQAHQTDRESSPDVSNYDSPLEDDELPSSNSTCRSVSDLDIQKDDGSLVTAESCWDRQYLGQMLMEGGYSNNVLDGDGNSAPGLSFPPPIETHSSSNNLGIAPGHSVTKNLQSQPPLSSESYTVSKETQGQAEAKSRRHSVPATASKSYTIVTSRVEQSALYDKVRHNSSGSSSGTDPKTESSEEGKVDQVDSSNGVSPEVSQTLEWDYGQDFDGKIPPLHSQENTMSGSASTGTSESLSDVLRDVSEHSDVIEPELPSGTTEDSDQFETPENDFENIDSLEDFPIFGKDPKAMMTDSGISDKDFDFNMAKSTSTICGNSSDECSREDDTSLATAKAMGSDSSQETIAAELIADTPVSVEEKDLPGENLLGIDEVSQVDSTGDGYSNSPGSVVSVEDVTTICERVDLKRAEVKKEPLESKAQKESDCGLTLRQDVLGDEGVEGLNSGKKERPISLLSTASADTGYAPDTDSEIGTLTTNTPLEWVDKHGMTHPTSYAPLEDSYLIGSPVDGDDFLKKESLALSRALRQQNSTQSTTSNPSDTEDFHEIDNSAATVVPSTSEAQWEVPLADESQIKTQMDVMPTSRVLEESELVDNTEDDRIEADQVHGPPGSSSSSQVSTRESTPPKLSPTNGDKGGDPGESTSGDGVGDSKQTDREEGKSGNETTVEGLTTPTIKETERKVNETEDKKPRARKPLVMTKKKMEVIDHKLPNTKVASKLADYIKAPTPVKPKEEKDVEENKISKNIKNISKKRMSMPTVGLKPDQKDNRIPSVERGENEMNDEESNENNKNRKKTEKIEKPKPIIKRTPPKSKWGNIMSQIEAAKDTTKPKPKSEIKSSLAAYLNAPPPVAPSASSMDAVVNVVNGDGNPPPPRKEFKSRHKPLPPPPPKIDLSKVKSKLSVPTAASTSKRVAKRETSPAPMKGPQSAGASRESSPATGPMTRSKAARVGRSRASEGNIVLVRQPLNSTATDSVRSSRTDLTTATSVDESLADEGTSSKATSSITENGVKKDRRLSNNSVKSSLSEIITLLQQQTKRMKNKLRNGDVDTTRRPRAPAKTTRLSNSPARITTRTIEIRLDSSPAGSSRRSSTASPTPVIVKAVNKTRTNPRGEVVQSTLSSNKPQTKPPGPSAKARNSVIPSKSGCCTAGFSRVVSLCSCLPTPFARFRKHPYGRAD